MNSFKMDKREILKRITRFLQWENKPPKLKRSTAICQHCRTLFASPAPLSGAFRWISF